MATVSRSCWLQGPYQVTFVDEEQHVLVAGILLDVLLQMPAAGAQGVPGIQDLHPTHTKPSTHSVHEKHRQQKQETQMSLHCHGGARWTKSRVWLSASLT